MNKDINKNIIIFIDSIFEYNDEFNQSYIKNGKEYNINIYSNNSNGIYDIIIECENEEDYINIGIFDIIEYQNDKIRLKNTILKNINNYFDKK